MNLNWDAPEMSYKGNSNFMLLVEGRVKKTLIVTWVRGDEEGTVSFSADTGNVRKTVDVSRCLERLCHHSQMWNPRGKSGLQGK